MTYDPDRRSHAAARRRAILEVARRLLVEEGFERFAMREVAKRSEMGLGNLQYYYRTRDALLVAVVRAEFEANLERIRALDGTGGDLGDYLDRFARLLIDEYTGPGGNIWSVLAMLRLHNAKFRRLSEEVYQEHYDVLADALRSFGIADASGALREKARLVTAVLDGAALQAHAGPHARDSHGWQSFCQQVVEIVVAVAKR